MDIPKKRGRPSTGGRKEGVLVRLPDEMLSALDAWRAEQPGEMSRPDAVRTILAEKLDPKE